MKKQKEKSQRPYFDTQKFWDAPDDALFNRPEISEVRRCSVAKMDYEAWRGTGIPVIKDSGRALYRKADVLRYLQSCRTKVEPTMNQTEPA
jgi:hypothetical protein